MSGWPAERLLVSSVNGGGVFLLGPTGVERWSRVDTVGMSLVPTGAVLARQAEGIAELRWLRGGESIRVKLADRSLDLHDVRRHGDRIHVVATQANAILELDADFATLRNWAFPGEEDSQHINSVCMHEGRLLASRFGRFATQRGYKGATRGAGEVFDVETGEVLVAGLCQPHSLVSHAGLLWLCDSEARTLRSYRGFEAVGALELDGYVRGLAFGVGGMLYAGLSRSRNAEPGELGSACVVAIDTGSMRELARMALPANEVYEIVVVPPAALDQLRTAAFADAIAEYDTMVDARNRAAGNVLAELQSLAAVHHQANLRIAALESEAAGTRVALDAARRALASAEVRAREDSAWAAVLEAGLADMAPTSADAVAVLASRTGVPVTGLDFEAHEAPLVSILVTSYGKFEQTRACLESIRGAGCAVPYEVILVEDASGEAEMDRFATVPGLRYRRNDANLGFLRSVNAALPLLRGEYVHLLNNDTVVRPGWLDGLLRSFALFQDCGMAGSMLVYPDGRLQEAGGIVWSDGSGCNIGRDGDASDPAHASVREVDYVSGASIMLRTGVFRELGGFDERYAPAYYEDTDLAFRLRERGLRTYYQSGSVVVHQEGLSHGTDVGGGGKSWQARNHQVFRERWATELQRAQVAPGEHVLLARSRAQLKKMVLVVDALPPHTDVDAGSRAMWQFMRQLWLHGLEVKFWSHQRENDQRHLDLLSMHAIEVVGNGAGGRDFEAWMQANGRYLDYVVLSRPHVASDTINDIRRHSDASVLYYGHDVHYLRLQREREVLGDGGDAAGVGMKMMQEMERRIWVEADLVLYPSVDETACVREWQQANGARGDAATIPLFAYDAPAPLPEASHEVLHGRDTVLFVGGFQHAPNADGITWFAEEVWPLVRRERANLRLVVIGANPSERMLALADDGIEVAGAVSESDLVAAYARARAVVVPLRFGAGMKGKVLEAMHLGVPCVTTSVGAQGLRDAACLAVADDAVEMVDALVRAADDDAWWMQASKAGQDFISARFSPQAVWEAIAPVVDDTPYASVAERLARHGGNG
ncbi:glycosyltransferase [Luteimonas sp. MJ250]|uniref:glycosyltransferase n=1 Tax=Luteimonas sp. MJ250 TaxID=3129236 RepID=UPI0031BBA199